MSAFLLLSLVKCVWCSSRDFVRLCLASIRRLPWFVRQYRQYQEMAVAAPSMPPLSTIKPKLLDALGNAGAIDAHYFHQDLFVARRVFERNPKRHLDVGSRIDGFVAHLAAFRQVEVLDIRPPLTEMHGIGFLQSDLMQQIAPDLVECCDSLSCLHAIEHFGLGRYADPLCPDGHIRGYRNLARMLQPGGIMYLSFPIGPRRVEFNAHRVFSLEEMLDMVHREFSLIGLSYVDDNGEFWATVEADRSRIQRSFDCVYGCAILELLKRG